MEILLINHTFSLSQELVDQGQWPFKNWKRIQKWPTLNLIDTVTDMIVLAADFDNVET